MTSKSDKLCIECGSKIIGRRDKKFCSDQCRTTHYNRLNSDHNTYVRNVNNILRKNRRILATLNPTGKIRIHQDKLRAEGFDFGYFTSIYTTKDGSVYHYCYEQGYLNVDKNWYLLVVKN